MPRTIDITKVIHAAGEAKLVNLEVPVRELVNSGLIGSVAAADEPWDLICADWITVVRKGPRFESFTEVTALAETLRSSLGGLQSAGAIRGNK
jgi:hypothetical protein